MSSGAIDVGDGTAVGTAISEGEVGGAAGPDSPEEPSADDIAEETRTCTDGGTKPGSSADFASLCSVSPSDVGDGNSVGTGISVGEDGTIEPEIAAEPDFAAEVDVTAGCGTGTGTSVGTVGRSVGGIIVGSKVADGAAVGISVSRVGDGAADVGEAGSEGMGISVGDVTTRGVRTKLCCKILGRAMAIIGKGTSVECSVYDWCVRGTNVGTGISVGEEGINVNCRKRGGS